MTQVPLPVQPIPPHCPYLAMVPPTGGEVVVVMTFDVVVIDDVVLVIADVVLIIDVVLMVDVVEVDVRLELVVFNVVDKEVLVGPVDSKLFATHVSNWLLRARLRSWVQVPWLSWTVNVDVLLLGSVTG